MKATVCEKLGASIFWSGDRILEMRPVYLGKRSLKPTRSRNATVKALPSATVLAASDAWSAGTLMSSEATSKMMPPYPSAACQFHADDLKCRELATKARCVVRRAKIAPCLTTVPLGMSHVLRKRLLSVHEVRQVGSGCSSDRTVCISEQAETQRDMCQRRTLRFSSLNLLNDRSCLAACKV